MQTTSACQHYVSRVGIIPSSTVYSLYIEFTSSGEKVRGRATRHYKLSHDSGHRELSAESVDRPEQWETRGKTDNWRLGCVIAPLSWAESSVSTVAADLFGLR